MRGHTVKEANSRFPAGEVSLVGGCWIVYFARVTSSVYDFVTFLPCPFIMNGRVWQPSFALVLSTIPLIHGRDREMHVARPSTLALHPSHRVRVGTETVEVKWQDRVEMGKQLTSLGVPFVFISSTPFSLSAREATANNTDA